MTTEVAVDHRCFRLKMEVWLLGWETEGEPNCDAGDENPKDAEVACRMALDKAQPVQLPLNQFERPLRARDRAPTFLDHTPNPRRADRRFDKYLCTREVNVAEAKFEAASPCRCVNSACMGGDQCGTHAVTDDTYGTSLRALRARFTQEVRGARGLTTTRSLVAGEPVCASCEAMPIATPDDVSKKLECLRKQHLVARNDAPASFIIDVLRRERLLYELEGPALDGGQRLFARADLSTGDVSVPSCGVTPTPRPTTCSEPEWREVGGELAFCQSSVRPGGVRAVSP